MRKGLQSCHKASKRRSQLAIPKTLKSCHPAILEAKRYLEQGLMIDDYAINYHHDEPVVIVRATKLARRALRLLEELACALGQRGLGLVRHHQSKVLGFGAGLDSVRFSLSEHFARGRFDDEKRPHSLKLRVDRGWLGGGKKSWTDGKRYTLEEKLGEIVDWVCAGVEEVKAGRLSQEEDARKRAEEQTGREKELQAKALEERRRAELLVKAEMWKKAKDLRSFIDACEHQFRLQTPTLAPESGEMKWLCWARQHLERIDLLKNGLLQSEIKRFASH